MDEMKNLEEQQAAEDAAPVETEVPAETVDETEELRAALLEAKIKLALLLAGTAKEKLAEAAKLVEGLCALGKAPEDAAAEIIGGYPHLKAVQRELPQLSAQTGGTDDGFALIRSIFSRR